MASHWVVNKDSESPNYKQMIACFDDAGKATCMIGPDQCWLEVPEGVAVSNAKVVEDEDGALQLVDSMEREGPKWDELRTKRNKRLIACDWTQLVDAPLSAPQKTAWGEYRTALRDLPQDSLSVEAVVWPSEPV